MAGTPTDWEWSAEAPAYQVDWTDADSLRLTDVEYLLKAIMECLREKCIASDTPVPALISDPYSPITSIKTYTDMIQSTVTALLPAAYPATSNPAGWTLDKIPKFMNHISSGGNYEGLTAIPHWTEADILFQIGAPSRLVLNRLNDLPDWCIQQYKMLNLLRWVNPYLTPYKKLGQYETGSHTWAQAVADFLSESWVGETPCFCNVASHQAYIATWGAFNYYMINRIKCIKSLLFDSFDISLDHYVFTAADGLNYYNADYPTFDPTAVYKKVATSTLTHGVPANIGYGDIELCTMPEVFGVDIWRWRTFRTAFWPPWGISVILKFDGANGFKFKNW